MQNTAQGLAAPQTRSIGDFFQHHPVSIAGKHGRQLIQAECDLLIYTAFINLICNKEITYGRAK
ncbi:MULTISPECIES: hypothetical protein [unclassified Pseudomonas]|uniref:hypothetical protein n=1 Tax=unclassified Pseudomonas TaxID=196821 RepID=UPI000C8877C5|nr:MULTISPECIES: hypothetical protein [unclassified Pseudomonas]PMZ85465.1 hypothetical protein C1X61_27295 [Pseudomonas sp. FW215-T2]PNA07563.1 hypothetical protein C1X62_27170 [Pseudomonas sp. FW215-R3]PNB33915.1 hypothetical protein C1X63_28120 [Pseudomonas sp. FW305-131]